LHEIASFFQFAEASDDVNFFEGLFTTAYKVLSHANIKLLFNLKALFKYNSTENLFRAITLPFRSFLNQAGRTKQDIKALAETCIDMLHDYFAFYQKNESVQKYGGWILSENLRGISNEHKEWLNIEMDKEASQEKGYGLNVFLSPVIGDQEAILLRLSLYRGRGSKTEDESIVEIRARGKEVWMCGGTCVGCPRTTIEGSSCMVSLYLLNHSQLVFFLNGQVVFQHRITVNLQQDSADSSLRLGLMVQYQGVFLGLVALHDADLELPQALWLQFPSGAQQTDQLDQFKMLLGNKEVVNFLSPVECCNYLVNWKTGTSDLNTWPMLLLFDCSTGMKS
jgi:hypothetical protein